MFRLLAVAISLIVGSTMIAEQSLFTQEEEKEFVDAWSELTEREKESLTALFDLNWKDQGTYSMPLSNSTISLPVGRSIVIGKDAMRLNELYGNPENESIEAITIDEHFHSVYFTNYKEGYVSIKDWGEINPDEFLQSIIENTEEANKLRRQKSFSELHVLGWLQEPTLDKHNNTVFWAIDAEDDDGDSLVNSVALRLGREGFEKIVWVTDRDTYTPFGGELDIMLRAHSFDPGFRYNDHKKGDKIASYGIASLVAAVAGAKIVKAGGIAVLLKKGGAVIAAGIATAFYKLRKFFKRRKGGDSNE